MHVRVDDAIKIHFAEYGRDREAAKASRSLADESPHARLENDDDRRKFYEASVTRYLLATNESMMKVEDSALRLIRLRVSAKEALDKITVPASETDKLDDEELMYSTRGKVYETLSSDPFFEDLELYVRLAYPVMVIMRNGDHARIRHRGADGWVCLLGFCDHSRPSRDLFQKNRTGFPF